MLCFFIDNCVWGILIYLFIYFLPWPSYHSFWLISPCHITMIGKWSCSFFSGLISWQWGVGWRCILANVSKYTKGAIFLLAFDLFFSWSAIYWAVRKLLISLAMISSKQANIEDQKHLFLMTTLRQHCLFIFDLRRSVWEDAVSTMSRVWVVVHNGNCDVAGTDVG